MPHARRRRFGMFRPSAEARGGHHRPQYRLRGLRVGLAAPGEAALVRELPLGGRLRLWPVAWIWFRRRLERRRASANGCSRRASHVQYRGRDGPTLVCGRRMGPCPDRPASHASAHGAISMVWLLGQLSSFTEGPWSGLRSKVRRPPGEQHGIYAQMVIP